MPAQQGNTVGVTQTVGHASGYIVYQKNPGSTHWVWEAYVGGNRRTAWARSERGAINKAQTALAEMQQEAQRSLRGRSASPDDA